MRAKGIAYDDFGTRHDGEEDLAPGASGWGGRCSIWGARR